MELAIALALMGVTAGLALQVQKTSARDCYVATKLQLKDIQVAIDRFAIKHNRLPAPARRTVGIEDPNFGKEVSQGDLTSQLTNAGGVSYGALPFEALTLAPSYASDCWGNKFTYAVTASLTRNAPVAGGYLDPAVVGTIKVKSSSVNALLPNAAYTVISHGANAVGAVKLNYAASNIPLNRRWCALGSALETENCDAGNDTVIAGNFNDGATAGTQSFDDLVVFRGKLPMRVDGQCGATYSACAMGTLATTPAPTLGACGGSDTWTCNGTLGGAPASCSTASAACPPPPVVPPVAPPPACDPSDPFGGCYVPPVAPPVTPPPVAPPPVAPPPVTPPPVTPPPVTPPPVTPPPVVPPPVVPPPPAPVPCYSVLPGCFGMPDFTYNFFCAPGQTCVTTPFPASCGLPIGGPGVGAPPGGTGISGTCM